jgi:hypothetical protein
MKEMNSDVGQEGSASEAPESVSASELDAVAGGVDIGGVGVTLAGIARAAAAGAVYIATGSAGLATLAGQAASGATISALGPVAVE